MKRITVDTKKCTGCRYCELACSGRRHGVFNPTLSAVTVIKDDHRGLDYPVICHQCVECPPEKSCPTGAIKRVDGCLVVEEVCVGCGLCVEACGYGAVKLMNKTPIICDLCGGAPECVTRCPTGALSYMEYSGAFNRTDEALNELQRRLGITG